jgi:hypothetical protein
MNLCRASIICSGKTPLSADVGSSRATYTPIETEAVGIVNMDGRLFTDLVDEFYEEFGVQIRHESIGQLNSSASAREEKITVLATALNHFDFEKDYVQPP